MQEELDEFVKNYKGNEDPSTDYLYCDIEKRYMKRYNKLKEDAYEVEQRHLTSLVDELSKEFLITKDEVRDIMEELEDTTEKLYIHIMENYGLRKPNKKKVKSPAVTLCHSPLKYTSKLAASLNGLSNLSHCLRLISSIL